MKLYSLTALALLCGCAKIDQEPATTPSVVSAPAPAAAPVPAPPAVVTHPGAICDLERDSETILRVQTAEAKFMPVVRNDPAFAGA